ncbi:hypothetical protein [Leptolyngbya sp. KIOST-1]|uniref:hypothetical protein n=1 Tax=Leptolyngbya sp. KIOST-1 TaxID=1229172 RepID=UPI00056C9CA1|nr:hypothetical protein [Leptolyngbya sp. KIOST-1]
MTSPRPTVATAPSPGAEVLVGLLVPPVLLGIAVAHALADGLTQAGLASEQLFAGERLPNLKVPQAPATHPEAAGTN